jgi:hypothetical protein
MTPKNPAWQSRQPDHRGRDRRRIPPLAQHYLVDVERVEGGRVAMINAAMRAEALDAYLHPFARPDVPDVVSEAASLSE